ncbi:HAD-IIB family hydrolase [Mycoplasmopsis agassizii]|uniref:HAD family phosphatase n=1 Tax=Mycoplasmopsis agassizii TaxID=33922 RepID=A0ABX4H560_9BACT|nr:HAD family hydrolase [Mycoplasmopsis agassizii]PAF55031.1 HAD family phosphatase [Mycoplasmopsis agassizii]SMC17503.1 hypothetical protein SAMN02745179_00468 [Mycoplasmopsis agassizii]
MKEIEAYFIDLDGTYVDIGHKNVSSANKQSVRQALKQGKKVIFATGRNMTINTMWIINSTNVKDAIFMNGAIIMIDGKIVKESRISLEAVNALNNYFMKTKPFVVLNSLIKKWVHTGKYYLYPLFFLIGTKILPMKALNTFYPVVHKYNIFSFSKKKIQKIVTDLRALNLDISIATSYKDRVIEITSKEASKGLAIEYVLQKHQIDKENAVHIGDSMNDYSAKNYVGKLIAMADSNESFLKLVDYVGPNHKKSGVAKIIKNNEFYAKIK